MSEMNKNGNAAAIVSIARNKSRPKVDDYINAVFTDFFEQKGDGLGREDKSILGGIALFEGRAVTVIGHRKGHNTLQNVDYNFGMASPEGFRKALRLMKQAEKFGRPVITFVDTPGAYPGLEAEMFGQSKAIAENLAGMSALKVPVISIITGEGSSGGALGIAVGNRVYMLENAVYSILSPEGFASILWHDSSRKDEAAAVMRLTAGDLKEFGVIDGIIEEDGADPGNYRSLFERIKNTIHEALGQLEGKTPDQLANERFMKFRNIDSKYLSYTDNWEQQFKCQE